MKKRKLKRFIEYMTADILLINLSCTEHLMKVNIKSYYLYVNSTLGYHGRVCLRVNAKLVPKYIQSNSNWNWHLIHSSRSRAIIRTYMWIKCGKRSLLQYWNNFWVHVPARLLRCVQLFVTLWTIARQDPLFMGHSRQEY